ncbi:hypothetical protein IQ268_31620 [Oculatella sp. LEGE 06141]|uniref:hypothetical protein n=1 Tax=Oculatella sp. LEGE 06141 TaxID=1828648 RepID=UPI00187E4420|nr:hypothetical protein [Oculatella sp. LEGE 06141]MBE9183086.1 hypothetical protein [Oculatella sp. LEGE 06141]
MVNIIIALSVIALAFLACLLIFILLKEIEKQNSQSQYRKIQVYSSSRPVAQKLVKQSPGNFIFKPSPSAPQQPVKLIKTSLARKLLPLVNGDMETAKRLVIQAREKNPGRSEQWCWEKVIYDLERDRRV